MGKHAGPIDPLNELRARLSIPLSWGGLFDAVQFLKNVPMLGKHVRRNGAGAVLFAKNAKAMRDWYLSE